MDEAGENDVNYCPSCGERLDRKANYCRACGEPISKRDVSRKQASGKDGPGTRRPPEPDADRRRQESPEPVDNQHGESSSGRGAARPPDRPKRDESPFWTVFVASSLGIGGVVFLILFSIPVAIISGVLDVSEVVVLGVGTGIGQYVTFAGLGLAYLRHRDFDWEHIRSYLGIRVPSLKELGVVILGYAAIFALIMVVGALVQAFGPEPAENQGAESLTGTTNPAIFIGAILMMFLVVGPCEELLYRGIVQNRLRERLNVIPAILIASAVFAAVHFVVLAPGTSLSQKITTISILFCPAIVLGAVYEYTSNLVVPALLHGIHNSIIVLVSFVVPEMQDNAELISGVVTLAGL